MLQLQKKYNQSQEKSQGADSMDSLLTGTIGFCSQNLIL